MYIGFNVLFLDESSLVHYIQRLSPIKRLFIRFYLTSPRYIHLFIIARRNIRLSSEAGRSVRL